MFSTRLPLHPVTSEPWPQYVMKCVFDVCICLGCVFFLRIVSSEGRGLLLTPYKTHSDQHSGRHTVGAQSVFGEWMHGDKTTKTWSLRAQSGVRGGQWRGLGSGSNFVFNGKSWGQGDLGSVWFSKCLSSLLPFVVLLSVSHSCKCMKNILGITECRWKLLMTLKSISSHSGCLKISVCV